jgi:spermidine synthase
MQRLICACLFLSGACGLGYEVLWGKHLQLFIGASSYAQLIVLATFMGGLAAGNALFGRLSDLPVRKLTLYGLLELGIGLSCFLFPITLDLAAHLYLRLAATAPGTAGNWLLKLLLSVVTMIVPTVLMGGTLPVLSRYFIHSLPQVGRRVASLYFINSAGAALGALLTGLWLIKSLGLHHSLYVLASANTGIGLLFLLIRKREPLVSASPVCTEEALPEGLRGPSRTYSRLQVSAAFLFIFLSGVIAMGLEIAWVRLLSLVLGSSVYSFAVMLFTFISGITMGALVVAKVMKEDRNAFLLLALSELGVFFSLGLLLPAYERLPYAFNVLGSALVRNEDTFLLYQTVQLGIAVAMMLVPTIGIGMTLPLVSHVCVRHMSILGKRIGSVFSVNTLGNMLGAALCGVVLIPHLGLQETMELFLMASGLLGSLLFFFALTGGALRRLVAFLALVPVLLFVEATTSRWNGNVFNTGFYRVHERLAHSYRDYTTIALASSEIVFQEDGPDVSVVVARNVRDGVLSLKVNGKADAGTGRDMETQLLLSHIPMLLHPHPQDVLMVGYGSGISSGALLTHPVRRYDIVEISETVMRGAHAFDRVNGRPLDDPRTHVVIADAKEFLKLQAASQYDVIISQPSNPWVTGMGNLFSKEYFVEAARHLKPHGMMAFWVQLYDTNDALLSVVLNTFSAVFPEVTAWQQNNDLVLVGSLTPQKLDPAVLAERIVRLGKEHPASPLIAPASSPLPFLAGQMLSSAQFKSRFPGTGTLNSDYAPWVEFEAPKAMFAAEEPLQFLSLDERFQEREANALLVAQYLGTRALTAEEYAVLVNQFSSRAGKNELDLGKLLAYRFMQETDGASDTEAVALFLRHGDLARYAEKRIWEQRVRENALSRADWEEYISFEFKLMLETSSVFADAEGRGLEEASRRYHALFPAAGWDKETDLRSAASGPPPSPPQVQQGRKESKPGTPKTH